ncbi:glutamine amidohydrolase-like protein [Nannochloropsis gaditana CCMP526]|uniref:glutamine amidohydrolase-like protein n=1 Tax=Nannochloropsis gaditana (strain CCMP526) TaxID=1093141 RepID=UPI00029F58D8|nr:glutamine amidohydrolase-like protein [Nannochloropsis gaditana CCMP526]EKU22427.1 glutamine amidohydrolase-like protein [Nannochloropsis gaditana CCMP526]|eukprot:XP_005853938.1 glutamine amidohydrolase-like protein [Nannochloropsis gaditana CCMP526]
MCAWEAKRQSQLHSQSGLSGAQEEVRIRRHRKEPHQDEHLWQKSKGKQQNMMAREPCLPTALALPRSCFTYTRCFCEENVYLLLAKLHALISSSEDLLGCQLSALFVSNSLKACPIWMQRETGEALGNADQVEDREEAGTEGNEENKIAEFSLNDGPILWDYHVVALLETPGGLAYVYDLDTRLEPFPCPAGAYVRKAFKPDLPLREEYRQGANSASAMTLPAFWKVDEEEEGEKEGGTEGKLGEVLSLGDLLKRIK